MPLEENNRALLQNGPSACQDEAVVPIGVDLQHVHRFSSEELVERGCRDARGSGGRRGPGMLIVD
jgi:hypothetical protein